jgi:CDP-6-deoxy-D-xylo-4-hexulose-3-dehydrase
MFKLQEDMISSEDIDKIVTLLRSGDRLTMGDNVTAFEKEFASHLNVPYAVMVNSGSSANLLAFAAITNHESNAPVEKGREVLIPCVCWSTSMWPIIQMGLIPVIVDVDPNTFQIDLEDMKRKVTNKTSAVLLVHIIGNCPNMDSALQVAKNHNLQVIEDTCESLGTTYKQRFLGTFGRFGTYSFYYSHHITTIEGGMIVCHTQEDADLLKCLRAHGWARNLSNQDEIIASNPDIDPRFLFVNIGYNLRPTEINAVLGLSQLKKLENFNNVRKHNYNTLKKAIANDPRNTNKIHVIDGEQDSDVAWFSLPVTITGICNIKKYTSYLIDNGIDNRPIVSGNFTKQPVLKKLGMFYDDDCFPGAEHIHNHCFYIGLSCMNNYNQTDVDKLVNLLFVGLDIL